MHHSTNSNTIDRMVTSWVHTRCATPTMGQNAMRATTPTMMAE